MKPLSITILAAFAFWIAGSSLYGLIDVDAQSRVFKKIIADVPWAGYCHIIGGSSALILGAFQMSSRIRKRFTRIHRIIGTAYVVCVAVATVGAIGGLPSSTAPEAAVAAFWTLAIIWPIVTFAGYPWKRKFDIKRHGRLMLYSYALTCAAISLRLILGPLMMSGVKFHLAYPIAAWGGMIVNLIIAFLILRFVATKHATSVTGTTGG